MNALFTNHDAREYTAYAAFLILLLIVIVIKALDGNTFQLRLKDSD
ncbi:MULTISPECIES: hypothetical protein [unclassified Lentimonas]|nr:MULTISPECIES: hypothetical protein [unclassified Lentimonas]